MRTDLGTAFGEQPAKITTVRDEMSNWARDHKVLIMMLLQQSGGGQSASTGLPRSADGKGPTIDKKELSVWKLPDQVTKHEFHHWLDAIDINSWAPGTSSTLKSFSTK